MQDQTPPNMSKIDPLQDLLGLHQWVRGLQAAIGHTNLGLIQFYVMARVQQL